MCMCMCKYNNGLFYIEKRRFSLFQLQIPSAAALKLLQALPAHLGSWMHVKGCQHFFYMCTYVDCLFSFEKSRFSLFFCRYHLQLHWSCWRAVPGHHGLRLHGTWCQYHCCMCMYDNCLFYIKKKRFSLFQLQIPYAAALKLLTSCFSTPWVMTAWNMMSILLLHVYICVLLILLKNTDFHRCSCRYHLQLHWSCWRAIPAHLGSWMHGTGCQYFFYMCINVDCLFCLKK